MMKTSNYFSRNGYSNIVKTQDLKNMQRSEMSSYSKPIYEQYYTGHMLKTPTHPKELYLSKIHG